MNDKVETCPFCLINREKTRVIEEKQHVIIVLSNPRLMPGHLLVVPKRHVERLNELRPDEKSELWSTVEEFQQRIINRLASGCDIRQHYRPFQKQDRLKVNHAHIHLQPREFEDELYRASQVHDKKLFRDLPKGEAKRIITALSRPRARSAAQSGADEKRKPPSA